VITSGRQSNAHPTVDQSASRGTRSARTAAPGLAIGIVLAVAATACGASSSPAHAAAPVSHTPSAAAPAMNELGAHSLPAQASQTLPAFPAFYDAHKDVVVSRRTSASR